MSGLLRYHDLTYKLLGAILRLGVASGVWTVKKLTATVFSAINKETIAELVASGKDPNKEINRLIYYAKQQGYLDKDLQTTQIGTKKLAKLEFTTLTMTQPWDGKWRLVMYDIPQSNNSARDQIRRLIKQLGFVQIQQSVWAHPLPQGTGPGLRP